MAKQQTIRFYNFILNLNEMNEFSFKRITVIKWHENKETLGQMEHGEYHRGIDRKTDTEERIINDSRLQTPIPSNSNFHVSFYNSQ